MTNNNNLSISSFEKRIHAETRIIFRACIQPYANRGGSGREERGQASGPPDIPTGRDLRTLWLRQSTGEVGYKRTVSEYNGPEEGRAVHRAQALEAAAKRYVPTETITTRKPSEENGAALHRWLGLGATPTTAPSFCRGPCTQGIGTEEEAPCEEGPDYGVLKASEGVHWHVRGGVHSPVGPHGG